MKVVVKDISKSYSTVVAVKNLSFQVHHGEIFAILGPNGAGKSSTIRMLIGLTAPDNGEIDFIPEKQTLPARLGNNDFAYLPEERGLFQETTILKTLVYMGQLKDMSKAEATEAAVHWLTRFELDDRMNDPLKTLSKGNQQKVQLISAIIHRPAIAFLDEPFSGLDPINQEKVIEFLAELKAQGTTIILSAHQMSLVEKLADRFLLMNKGEAALYGDIGSIRKQSALGTSLLLTFEQVPEPAQLCEDPDVLEAERHGDNGVMLHLQNKASLPDLLQRMLNNHKVMELQTMQPTLHEIYLHSLQGDKA